MCDKKKKNKKKKKKNEETQPIFEVAYLGNARSDFAQIWNVECCSWGACPQQKSSCFIKEAQSYGGAKIAFSSCQYTHGCYAPASWAARHTTVCLDIYIYNGTYLYASVNTFQCEHKRKMYIWNSYKMYKHHVA